MRRKVNIFPNIDWLTVAIFLALIFIGWINIYSADWDEAHQSIFDFSRECGKQFIWISTSLVLALVILLIDSKFYPAIAYFVYGVLIFSLLAVLLFGIEKHGAKSWFKLGDFLFQPSEFAKFATALAISRYIGDHGFSLSKLRNVLITGAILLGPVLFIILQNDTGSALVYSSFILVLYREKLPGIILVIGLLIVFLFVLSILIINQIIPIEIHVLIPVFLSIALLAFGISHNNYTPIIVVVAIYAASVGLFYIMNELFDTQIEEWKILLYSLLITSVPCVVWAFRKKVLSVYFLLTMLYASLIYSTSVEYIYNNVIGDHQRKRINVFLGVVEDIRDAGYNVYQSKVAIGSGSLWGKGFLEGTQTKFKFVPEQSTDFIFCTVGEEWGFVGAATVIVLYLTLIIRIIVLADKQRSDFARIYGYGLASILLFHFVINIGMTIGLMPIIGIPLPFLSYGGSSLWSFTILLFIFVRLASSRTEDFKKI